MANITGLQMWKDICNDSRISIQKSFFGLRTIANYRPTNSVIEVHTYGYSPSDGSYIKHILETPGSMPTQIANGFKPKPIANGNYQAEVSMSADRNFLAVKLFQFERLNYVAVTDTLVFEGESARALSGLF